MHPLLLAAVFVLIGACLGCQTAGADPAAATVPAALFEKARRESSVRVVVNLRLGPGSTEEAVRAAREALLRDLGTASYRVVRQYATIPAVALVASADALGRLARSAHVTSVHEDVALEPKR